MNELMNEWINHGGDCRTAPATPGLLNIKYFIHISIKYAYKFLFLLDCKYYDISFSLTFSFSAAFLNISLFALFT